MSKIILLETKILNQNYESSVKIETLNILHVHNVYCIPRSTYKELKGKIFNFCEFLPKFKMVIKNNFLFQTYKF